MATGALPSAITVASANLVDGTIVTADLADASVTSPKLASPTLTAKATAFSLALVDANCTLRCSAAFTVTVPDSTIAFSNGAVVTLLADVAGDAQVVVDGAAGVTINSSNGKKLRTRYSMATLVKISNTEWVLSGDTVA